MAIIINIDVMLAKRKMSVTGLAGGQDPRGGKTGVRPSILRFHTWTGRTPSFSIGQSQESQAWPPIGLFLIIRTKTPGSSLRSLRFSRYSARC